jgi:hypothetical protein
MKNLYIILAFSSFIMSSCSTTYHSYLVAESPDLKADMYVGFVEDLDSVKVTYMFTGRPLNFLITIENKSNRALYLDWNKTAFIVDGNLRSVANPLDLSDITSTHAVYFFNDGVQINQTASGLQLPLKFIPSNSKFTFRVRSFREWAPDIETRKKMRKQDLHPESRGDGGNVYVESQKDSPTLRAVLTMHFENNEKQAFAVDHSFIMTNQYKIKARRDANPNNPRMDRGYFVHIESNAAGPMLGMVAVFLLVVSIAAM